MVGDRPGREPRRGAAGRASGRVRATLLALGFLAAAGPLPAQSAGRSDRSPWIGRFAVGQDVQDPWAYQTHAWSLGGTVGRRLGERLALRADLWHARFGGRIVRCDTICGANPYATTTSRAADREDQWGAGAMLEWRPERSEFYLTGGIAAVRRTGEALGSPGVSVGPVLGLGWRLGAVVALEARLVRLVGTTPGREAWSLPLVVSFGP